MQLKLYPSYTAIVLKWPSILIAVAVPLGHYCYTCIGVPKKVKVDSTLGPQGTMFIRCHNQLTHSLCPLGCEKFSFSNIKTFLVSLKTRGQFSLDQEKSAPFKNNGQRFFSETEPKVLRSSSDSWGKTFSIKELRFYW